MSQPGSRGLRIAVLVSGRGRGTNFAAILEGCCTGRIDGQVALLVSTAPDTPAMSRAEAAGIPGVYLADARIQPALVSQPLRPILREGEYKGGEMEPKFGEREAEADVSDRALLHLLLDHQIDLVCLAGFMRKVGPSVLQRFAHRIMNIHPSLAPAFSGSGMYGIRVHQAVLEYGAKISGCTVQFINEEYDAGPVILQKAVPVLDDDTPESLAARVLEQEHIAYVEAIRLFAAGRLQVEGRRVRVIEGAP